MNRVYPVDLPRFLGQFRFAGGRIRSIRLRYLSAEELTADLRLLVRRPGRSPSENSPPVPLRIRLLGVSEFRFQKRPGTPGGRIPDFRIGYFGDSYFINLDAFMLAPGETPKLHDFRASEAYVAGRELWWEESRSNGAAERDQPGE
jgi:hypothetical protein